MPKPHRVAFVITANEFKAIEDWRRRQNILPSRPPPFAQARCH
jgi:hypothetical protein